MNILLRISTHPEAENVQLVKVSGTGARDPHADTLARVVCARVDAELRGWGLFSPPVLSDDFRVDPSLGKEES